MKRNTSNHQFPFIHHIAPFKLAPNEALWCFWSTSWFKRGHSKHLKDAKQVWNDFFCLFTNHDQVTYKALIQAHACFVWSFEGVYTINLPLKPTCVRVVCFIDTVESNQRRNSGCTADQFLIFMTSALLLGHLIDLISFDLNEKNCKNPLQTTSKTNHKTWLNCKPSNPLSWCTEYLRTLTCSSTFAYPCTLSTPSSIGSRWATMTNHVRWSTSFM